MRGWPARHAEHRLVVPGRVWEGPGAARQLPELAARYGRPFLVVIDPNVATSRYGRHVLDTLQRGRDVTIWSEPAENTPRRCVARLASVLDQAAPGVVVAVGGGSTLDLAKLANAARALPAVGKQLPPAPGCRPRVPLVAVPTTCGTGSETTPFAVMLDEARPAKRGVTSDLLRPDEVVLDPLLLESLPAAYVAATAVDALAHALESSLSTRATHLTRCAARGALATITTALTAAVGGDQAARERLLAASASARLLYPRTGLTIAHALSHPLGAVTGMHHGAAVACVLHAACQANAAACPAPFAELAEVCVPAACPASPKHAARAFLDWLAELLEGLPLDGLMAVPPLTGEQVAFIAREAMRSSNVPSNPAPVSPALLEGVLRRCLPTA